MSDDGESANSGSGGGGGWFTGFITAIQESSAGLIEQTKHDLVEFVSAVKADTVNVAHDTADALHAPTRPSREPHAPAETDDSAAGSAGREILDTAVNVSSVLAKKMTSILSGDGSPAIAPVQLSPSKPPATQQSLPSLSASLGMSRFEAELHKVQFSRETYCGEVKDKEHYSQWDAQFDIGQCQERISEMISTMKEFRQLHSSLVPSQLSYRTFWSRYFYAESLIKSAQQTREVLLKRVEEGNGSEEDLNWGEPDESDCESETERTNEDQTSKTSKEEIDEEPSAPVQRNDSNASSDVLRKSISEAMSSDIVTPPNELLSQSQNDSDDDWEKWE